MTLKPDKNLVDKGITTKNVVFDGVPNFSLTNFVNLLGTKVMLSFVPISYFFHNRCGHDKY